MKVNCTLLSLLFFSFTALSFNASAQTAPVNVADSLALVDLYNSTNGPNWSHRDNWLNGRVRTWYGITVVNGRVRKVQLPDCNLVGTLPASIGNLTDVTVIDFDRNFLTGDIPTTITNLINLTFLNFRKNQLTGKIPADIGNLVNLTYLNFSINQLTGTIPSSICNLVNLTDLYISDNQTTGEIPRAIGNLNKLFTLNLRNCHYTGTIPSSIGRITPLVNLYLDQNNLRGVLPQSLLHLRNLNWVELAYNQLTFKGYLNPAIGEYINAYITISFNRFTFDGIEQLSRKITYYAPQAPIKIHKHDSVLAVSAGGTLSNNRYQWYKVGKKGYTYISGDSTFKPIASGKYFARITNVEAPRLTLETDTVQYSKPVEETPMLVTLYPNPASSVVTVKGLDTKRVYNIIVADVSGTVFINATARNQSNIRLNVSKLKRGNYLLSVNNGEQIKTLKLLKD